MTPLERYQKLVSRLPDQTVKGAANKYTSINGNMFSFLNKDTGGLSIRLGKDERETFLKKYKAELSVSYNTVMKEYPLVPAVVFENTRTMNLWFAKSYAYASGLKPNPSQKNPEKKDKKKVSKKKTSNKKIK